MNQSFLIEKLLNIVQELHEASGVPAEERIKEKNILGSADPNKRISPVLNSAEIRRTTHIATLFAKTFFEYKKKYVTKDEKPDTLIKDVQRKIQPPPLPEKDEKKGKMSLFLAGLIGLIGTIGAIMYALVNGGPFMGIIKILGKVGIKGFTKILTAQVKLFVGSITKMLKMPISILSKIGVDIGGIFKGLMGKIVPAGLKGFGKKGMGKILMGIGKILLKGLKRIPLVGSILSIGFAISRFMRGDVVGGVIDVLSALSGLLYLVPGGQPFAFVIGLGLDILNAWLDYKTGGATGKEGTAKKLDLLKELGKWLLPKLKGVPIIGAIYELSDAHKAVKSGDWLLGLRHMTRAVGSMVGITQLYDGYQMLSSMFGDKSEKVDEPKTKGISWIGKIKEWVRGKLKHLPLVLRKPLEWLGIMGESKDDVGESISSSDLIYSERIKNFSNSVWNGLAKFGDKISEGFKNNIPKISKIIGNLFKKIGGYIKGLFSSSDRPEPVKKDEKKSTKSGGLTDIEKAAKAEAAGHTSWEEYKKSGWEWKQKEENGEDYDWSKMFEKIFKITGDIGGTVFDTANKHIGDIMRSFGTANLFDMGQSESGDSPSNPTNTTPKVVITSDNKDTKTLNEIAKTHFSLMNKLISNNESIYNVLLKIYKKESTSLKLEQASSRSGVKNSPNISTFNDNRGGYKNSDYSFA